MPIQLAQKLLGPLGIEMRAIVQRRMGVGGSLDLMVGPLGIVQVHRRVAVVDFFHFGRFENDLTSRTELKKRHDLSSEMCGGVELISPRRGRKLYHHPYTHRLKSPCWRPWGPRCSCLGIYLALHFNSTSSATSLVVHVACRPQQSQQLRRLQSLMHIVCRKRVSPSLSLVRYKFACLRSPRKYIRQKTNASLAGHRKCRLIHDGSGSDSSMVRTISSKRFQALSPSIGILPRVVWLVWLGHYSGFCVSLDEEPSQLALLGESAPMPGKYSSALYGWQQCKDNTLTSCPGRWLSSQAGHMEEIWKGGMNTQE